MLSVEHHACCEEYAEGCISCTMHQEIRKDERRQISALIAAEGPWCGQCQSYEYAISLSRLGEDAETVYVINPDFIEEDSLLRVAYIHVTQEEVFPPVKTITSECLIDVDSDGKVLGIEILNWPARSGSHGS